jgi:hypothetical protein
MVCKYEVKISNPVRSTILAVVPNAYGYSSLQARTYAVEGAERTAVTHKKSGFTKPIAGVATEAMILPLGTNGGVWQLPMFGGIVMATGSRVSSSHGTPWLVGSGRASAPQPLTQLKTLRIGLKAKPMDSTMLKSVVRSSKTIPSTRTGQRFDFSPGVPGARCQVLLLLRGRSSKAAPGKSSHEVLRLDHPRDPAADHNATKDRQLGDASTAHRQNHRLC